MVFPFEDGVLNSLQLSLIADRIHINASVRDVGAASEDLAQTFVFVIFVIKIIQV